MHDDAIVVGTVAQHSLVVDHSERTAPLLRLLCASGLFAVQMGRLSSGDYLIDDRILVERKTRTDFVASLIDGRLFPQVARLAKSRYRSLLLIEGPVSASAPDVHPHSVEGALVSIGAMWRLPVLHATDADESCRFLQFLADQGSAPCQTALPRYDRKPKRVATRRGIRHIPALTGGRLTHEVRCWHGDDDCIFEGAGGNSASAA